LSRNSRVPGFFEDLLAVCLTQVMAAGTMPNNTYQEDFRRLVYQALV